MERSETVVALAPVRGRDRIDVLDVLRGLAILGIFFMNIPFMGGSLYAEVIDIRLQGWTPADQWAWSIIEVVAEGTQRGTLEMLFGAGMMILAARAMEPTGPVAVADLYTRRALWLLAFGLADIFLLLWPGDILHVYALASLFLFPFRRMAPKALIAIGLLWAAFNLVGGVSEYAARSHVVAYVEGAKQASAEHRAWTPAQKQAVATWNRELDKRRIHDKQKRQIAEERTARLGGFAGYARWVIAQWIEFAAGSILFNVIEAFSTMLIGIALYKWGVIQGLRERRFYLIGMLCAYGFGFAARALGVHERFWFMPYPKTIWATEEFARLAVTIGHIMAVNLLLKTGPGRALLHPFRAAGRTAFSLYVLETIIGMWILFPGFGLGLWNRFGWFGLAMVALAVQAGLLVLANIWVRQFQTGPLEWVWRSLAYWQMQPFRRRGPEQPLVVGP